MVATLNPKPPKNPSSAPTIWIPAFDGPNGEAKPASPTRPKSHTISHTTNERLRFLSVDAAAQTGHSAERNGKATSDDEHEVERFKAGFLTVANSPMDPPRPKSPAEMLKNGHRERFMSVQNGFGSAPSTPSLSVTEAESPMRDRFKSIAAISQAHLPHDTHLTDTTSAPTTPLEELQELNLDTRKPSSDAGHARNHHRSSTGGFMHDHAEESKKNNRILVVLMRRLGSSKTFGENVIFMLNRLSK
jgi:hypothetical protein